MSVLLKERGEVSSPCLLPSQLLSFRLRAAQNRAAQSSQSLEVLFPDLAGLSKPSVPAMSRNAILAKLPLELASWLRFGFCPVRAQGWLGQGVNPWNCRTSLQMLWFCDPHRRGIRRCLT